MTVSRHLRNIVILSAIVSWLFMLTTGACAMPKPLAESLMAGMAHAGHQAANNHADHEPHGSIDKEDCSLQPCPDGQPAPPLSLKLDHPEVPLLFLGLAWLSSWLLADRRKPIRLGPLNQTPDDAVPLIYRFCILLN